MGLFSPLERLCRFFFPFGNIFGPLLIWLIKRNEFPYVDAQGKEAVNFQILITIYSFISAILIVVVIGIALLGILFVWWIVLTIVASVKASDGVSYRYPLTIRIFK